MKISLFSRALVIRGMKVGRARRARQISTAVVAGLGEAGVGPGVNDPGYN